MIRYRDQIERELYGARQRLKASEHMVETTAKATTLAIHTRAAEAARRRIAALEAEHAAAPIRPRDNGGFRRSLSPLQTLDMGYPTWRALTPGKQPPAADGDNLDIPDFLRRQP